MASADAGSGGRRLDEDTARWLADLGGTGLVRERTIGRLHEMLLRIARADLRRRGARQLVTGPELDDPGARGAPAGLRPVRRGLRGPPGRRPGGPELTGIPAAR